MQSANIKKRKKHKNQNDTRTYLNSYKTKINQIKI